MFKAFKDLNKGKVDEAFSFFFSLLLPYRECNDIHYGILRVQPSPCLINAQVKQPQGIREIVTVSTPDEKIVTERGWNQIWMNRFDTLKQVAP